MIDINVKSKKESLQLCPTMIKKEMHWLLFQVSAPWVELFNDVELKERESPLFL